MNTSLSNLVKLALLGALLSLASCANLYNKSASIPGLDRILNYFSKAQVGPVKKANGEIIQGTGTDLIGAEDKNLTTLSGSTESAKSPSLQTSTVTSIEPPGSVATASDLNSTAVLPKTSVKQQAQPKSSAKNTNNVISGKVKLLAKKGEISPVGVMVRLNRTDGSSLQKPAVQASHEIDMIGKAYTPGNIVIRKGDAINFVNSDLIQHNVFSSTGENAFDLGTYGGGLQREVRLNKEGVVKVYCNIHPGMAAFVAVDDTGVSQVVNSEDGFFEFLDLPAGEYQLTLWSVRGEQTQQVILTSEQKLHLDLSLDTSGYELPEHANKFGETYKSKNIRREFY